MRASCQRCASSMRLAASPSSAPICTAGRVHSPRRGRAARRPSPGRHGRLLQLRVIADRHARVGRKQHRRQRAPRWSGSAPSASAKLISPSASASNAASSYRSGRDPRRWRAPAPMRRGVQAAGLRHRRHGELRSLASDLPLNGVGVAVGHPRPGWSALRLLPEKRITPDSSTKKERSPLLPRDTGSAPTFQVNWRRSTTP